MNCIRRLEYHNQVAQIRLSVDSMSFHRTHPRLRSVHMPALPLHKQVYTPFHPEIYNTIYNPEVHRNLRSKRSLCLSDMK